MGRGSGRYSLVQRLAAGILVATTACGLGVAGNALMVSNPADETEGGADADAEMDAGPDSPFVFAVDASQERCLAACEAGTCEDGWCTHACAGPTDCAAKIVCPPGIPCRVNCGGPAACRGGIECVKASACDVACEGAASCDGRVVCSGAQCDVRCSGAAACNNAIACDAGACKLACSGAASCQLSKTTCLTDDCLVECSGPPPTLGKPTCGDGVACEASRTCDIRCTETSACSNGQVSARAGVRADVRCHGTGTCVTGVVGRSPETTISCSDVSACSGAAGIGCDGGSCQLLCADTVQSIRACCKASKCTHTPTNCVLAACE